MEVYLASYEIQHTSYGIKFPKETNLFLTYFYPKQLNKALPSLKPCGHEGIVTIDSGAHSFFGYLDISATQNIKKDKKDMPNPHEYFKGYVDWVVENYDLIDFFVELDIQEIVGYDEILRWRELYKEKGIYDKCITVYHSSNTFKEFEAMVEHNESGYIGLEGLRANEPMLPYNKFLKYCYERKVKVHGFAFTKIKLLHKYPFYSVDSSTWTNPIRYGAMPKWVNGGMKHIKGTPFNLLKHGLSSDFNTDQRSKDVSRKKLEYSGLQYRKMGIFFTQYWESRGIKWQKWIK